MGIYEGLVAKKEKLALVGLGYVGMPIAVAFAKKVNVIGFDLNREKIRQYQSGIDPTGEAGDEAVRNTTVDFTDDENALKEARFIVIAVPTPIKIDKTPNLQPVESASEIVGRNLSKGSIVVYESTVYPGVTENICIPILEKHSGLVCGKDFKIGYSPERINPGDKLHRLENIKKIVSGMDEDTLEQVAKVYELVITAGVHRASSIKVAEAAKVAENSQRDINIAFMNELAKVFDRMKIDTIEVVEAMNTKWNALRFYPGLVGGHCIGVDPYYFVYEAEKLGYHSEIILAGRKINDDMSHFVAEMIIKEMALAGKVIKRSKVAILGITFKENCPDIRNSKVADIVSCLRDYGIEPIVVDPYTNTHETESEYNIQISQIEDLKELDCVVFAVAHNQFREISKEQLEAMFIQRVDEQKVIIDVKSMLNKKWFAEDPSYRFWRL